MEFLELVARGQLAEPQQIAGFLEIGVVGQFVNVNATVGQHALFPVDVADAGSGGDHSLQAFCGDVRGGQAGHDTSLKLLDFGCGRTGGKTTRAVATDFYTPKVVNFPTREYVGHLST